MTEPLAGYEPLAEVLSRALEQAQSGKGDERHANGLPFLEQPIMVEQRQQKGTGFVIGQARKKSLESMGLEAGAAVRELLGAINYLAAAVIYLEEGPGEEPAAKATQPHLENEHQIVRLVDRPPGLMKCEKCGAEFYSGETPRADKSWSVWCDACRPASATRRPFLG